MTVLRRTFYGSLLLLFFLSMLEGGSSFAGGNFCGFQCSKQALDWTMHLFSGVPKGISDSQSCRNEPLPFVGKDPDLALGARKAMAMIYGTCQVLTLPVRNLLDVKSIPKGAVSYRSHSKRYIVSRSKVIENHPYLNTRVNPPCDDDHACVGNQSHASVCDKNSCFVMNHPPLYQYGVKPKNYSPYVVTRRSSKSAAASGIDCSAFVSEAMNIVGARVVPGENMSSGGLGTSQFWQLGATDASGHAKDCFSRVIEQTGFRPGDLIVAPGKHVVMVDTVGDDPFGIQGLFSKSDHDFEQNAHDFWAEKRVTLKKMSLSEVLDGSSDEPVSVQRKFLDQVAEAACDQMLDPEEFKVTIIHSSPHGGHVGVQRERLFPGVGAPKGSAPMAMTVIAKAKVDCEEALRRKWLVRAKQKNASVAKALNDDFGYVNAIRKREDLGHGARVLRHADLRPGCMAPVGEGPTVPGSECMSCCSTQASYANLVPEDVHDDGASDAGSEEDQQ